MRALTTAALFAATLVTFAGAARNDWILFDDPEYVTENAHVLAPFSPASMRWSLTEPHGGNWHPLTSWSHMLDVRLFGTNPHAHHAESVLWHALNAVLLLLALSRLTGAWWRSLAVAALFALHPLRVESVAWASERKDVLSGCFFLLTLIAYAAWARRGGAGRYALAAVALALGLLSKPMLVSAPIVLLVLDGWPLDRLRGAWRARLLEKWPLFAMVAVFVAITYAVQHRTGAVTGLGALPLPVRVSNALVHVWSYVGRSLWPAGLTIFYPHPRAVQMVPAALGLMGLVAASALALAQRARRPWLLAGWLWFLVMLLPVIGLVQVGRQAWADRYSYLPTIGLALALVWTVAEWAARSRARRIAAVAALAVSLVALGIASARQVSRWRDSETLFAWTLRVSPQNAVGHVGLANAYMKLDRASDAVREYRAALVLEPDDEGVRERLADALVRLGRWDEARATFLDGLKRFPSAHGWHDVGLMEMRLGHPADALRAYERSLALDPSHALTHARMADALRAMGREDDALAHLRRAAELEPDAPEFHARLAGALQENGHAAEALEQYAAVLRATPDDVAALAQSAWLRATAADDAVRDGAEAMALAERARKAAGEHPPALVEAAYAAAAAESGDFAGAVAAAMRAEQLASEAGAKDEAALYARQLARYKSGKPLRGR